MLCAREYSFNDENRKTFKRASAPHCYSSRRPNYIQEFFFCARSPKKLCGKQFSKLSKDVLTDGSYCHTKFESIREETLASSQPVLKDTDDIVDFYGVCNHDPLGKEEIQSQKLEMQHRFQSEYND